MFINLKESRGFSNSAILYIQQDSAIPQPPDPLEEMFYFPQALGTSAMFLNMSNIRLLYSVVGI